MAEYWQRHWPDGTDGKPLRVVLSPSLLPRDGHLADYRNIAWKKLLSDQGGSAPILDLTRSDLVWEIFVYDPIVEINRSWDIDSVIARVTNLSVHRGGFDLAYCPPYLQRIQQNPYVPFQGTVLHQLKNQRLGKGLAAGGYGYECHIIFPHMPVTQKLGTHLTNEQQQTWLDEIVLPALKVTCPKDILQHHPRSFQEVQAKASVRKEIHPTGSGQNMDLRYCIPEIYLSAFWTEVQRHCESERHPLFRDAFLIVSGHGLKLSTKKISFAEVKTAFMEHLNTCFHVNEELMPAKECWVDLGQEDTPEPMRQYGLTLLRKSACTHLWADQFKAVNQRSNLLRKTWFPWALTRDAGSMSVEILRTNKYHSEGGVAYNKAYNLHKDLFATPMKGLIPFELAQLEGLAFDQELLNRWYELSHRGGQTSHLQKRKQLHQVYQQVKSRVKAALKDTLETCFGVRQEYRINLHRLRRLNIPATVPDLRTCHRPYNVFFTGAVNNYLAADVDRWLLCIEVLLAQTEQGPAGLDPCSAEQQMVNGVMVSAMIRTLQANLGAKRHLQERSLWSKNWMVKERRPDQADASDEENGAMETMKLGLNYDRCHQRHGLALLPADLIEWQGLPTFSPHLIGRLGLAKNGFGRHLHQGQTLHHKVHADVGLIGSYKQRLVTSLTLPEDSEDENGRPTVFQLGAELVIQAYIQEIWAILKRRHGQEDKDVVREQLSAWESAGLMGCSFDMIEKLFDDEPHVIYVKRAPRRGTSLFAQYDMNTWAGRLSALFRWNDQRQPSDKIRGWEHSPFRVLSKRLAFVIDEELGSAAAEEFVSVLISHAARKLWIIPQFDLDKLSVMRKTSKHHGTSTREVIRALSEWDRTNWIMPQLPRHLHGVVKRLDCGWDGDAKINWEDLDRWDEIKEIIDKPATFMVRTEGDAGWDDEGLIKNPHRYGQDLKLHHAITFTEGLERLPQ